MLPFSLLGNLASGGFSELKLIELRDGRRAVMRRLLSASILHPREHFRFRRGTNIRAILSPHKNLIDSYDHGYDLFRPYEIIEYVQGDNLKAYFNVRNSFVMENREYILEQCASAIAHVHSKGYMHLDVKPENFMCQLRDKPIVKLTDFDLARPASATGECVQMGTPVYMAPEQLTAKRWSSQSADVFAFGVMAYLLFTEKMPFNGSTPKSAMKRHKSELCIAPMVKDSNPEVSDRWNSVIAKALEKRIERRYKNMNELLSDLWS